MWRLWKRIGIYGSLGRRLTMHWSRAMVSSHPRISHKRKRVPFLPWTSSSPLRYPSPACILFAFWTRLFRSPPFCAAFDPSAFILHHHSPKPQDLDWIIIVFLLHHCWTKNQMLSMALIFRLYCAVVIGWRPKIVFSTLFGRFMVDFWNKHSLLCWTIYIKKL